MIRLIRYKYCMAHIKVNKTKRKMLIIDVSFRALLEHTSVPLT